MIRYYTANITGPYHLDNGIPCQDSFYVKRDNNGVIYAGVADGLGSENNSDVGSRIASRKSCNYCLERYQSGMSFSEVKKIMNNAFVNAYKAVLEEAQTAGNSPDEYDTTLCIAIFDDGHVFYGQSGDSGIIALLENGEYIRLTKQQRDEDGYVFPLCCGPDMWVFGEVESSVSSVMLMTDGMWEQLCPPLLRNHDVKINVALASKFMDRCETSLRSAKALGQAASRYIENYPRSLIDDDKTIVVIYDPLRPAEKMPDEYYKAPDWIALQKAAEANLYADFGYTDKDGKEESSEHLEEHTDNSEIENEDKLDRNCGPPADNTEDASPLRISNTEFAPKVINVRAQASNTHSTNVNKRHKNTKKINSVTAKFYGFLFLLILLIFSVAAFAMNGFVKEYAPKSYFGVLIVSLIANSTILLPTSSISAVVQYSMILNPIAVTICGAFGASLGEMVGFMAGVYGQHFIGKNLIGKIKNHLPHYPYIFILVFSALPLPLFDLVGMTAGVIRLNKLKFYITCLMGKLLKITIFVWTGQILANYISQ